MKTTSKTDFKITPTTTVKKHPTVAISIVTWNNQAEIRDCLNSLKDLPPSWEIRVVDNNSSDRTVEIVRAEFPFVKLIANPDNRGFAEANNQVINQTRSDYVLILNPDTQTNSETLVKALEIIEKNSKIGLLAVRLANEDGSLQTNCFHFPTVWKNLLDAFGFYGFYSKEKTEEIFAGEFFAHHRERPVDWVMGAFMLARREAVQEAGAIPEDYFMFAEDLDWCWQIKQKGFEIWFSPEVTVIHQSNKSAGQRPPRWRVERTTLSKYLFCYKNFGRWKTRLIQISDFLGLNYKILRANLRKPRSNNLPGWKLARREIFKSLFLSRRKIAARLQERS